jgi:hypothetical protein
MGAGERMSDRAGTHYEQAPGPATREISRGKSRHCGCTSGRQFMSFEYSLNEAGARVYEYVIGSVRG